MKKIKLILSRLLYYWPENVRSREASAKYRERGLVHRNEELLEELKDTRMTLQPVIDKLVRLRRDDVFPPHSRRFRLVIDLDERIVHETLVHGYTNDKGMVRAMTDCIAAQIIRELRTINFSRYRQPDCPCCGEERP